MTGHVLRWVAQYIFRIEVDFLILKNWRLARHPEWITIVLGKNVIIMDVKMHEDRGEMLPDMLKGDPFYHKASIFDDRTFYFIQHCRVMVTTNQNIRDKGKANFVFDKSPQVKYGVLKTNLIIRILRIQIKRKIKRDVIVFTNYSSQQGTRGVCGT